MSLAIEYKKYNYFAFSAFNFKLFMSGHSKWATTKRKKAAIDSKRAQVFTKLAKVITIAARDGGGDPSSNPSLRMAVDNAKAKSMPKENIERAINKGAGREEGANIEEVVYEAYGPGKVGMIIECLTDNKNRALSEIKSVLNKGGGALAGAGSVAYNFTKRGEIVIDKEKNGGDEENIENAILESGADDFECDEDIYLIWCDFANLKTVKESIESSGVVIDSAEAAMMPRNKVSLDEENGEKAIKLIESLELLDDVNKIYTNVNL